LHVPTTEELWEQFFVEEDEERMLVQAELLVQRETKDWPNDYRGDFLWDIAPAALISAKKNHIYPSVVLAQGILESGWGRSNLAQEHNNLFGVKGRKGNRSVQINTLETVRGRVVRQKAFFRHFDSWRESIAYHGRLLGSSHYYLFAKPIAKDAKHYLQLIAPRYASQPDYANYVATIIDEYHLTRWDFVLSLLQNRKTD
jgi:flagellum-specific peptidoglycan hydrolase FlgJ